MKNIELKIRANDFKETEQLLKKIKAKYIGALNQKDTYYNCTHGRLKTRENNNKSFELIFYDWPDELTNKLSNYSIIKFDKVKFNELKKILTQSAGVKTVVSKNRKLWLYKNTRIHLDHVNKLGNFLELETVLEKISKSKGEIEFFEVYDLLKLEKYKKIKESYSDLLLK